MISKMEYDEQKFETLMCKIGGQLKYDKNSIMEQRHINMYKCVDPVKEVA